MGLSINPLKPLADLASQAIKIIFPDKQERHDTDVKDQISARAHDVEQNISVWVSNFRALIRPTGGALVLFTHFNNIYLGWKANGFERFEFTYYEHLINFAIITYYFGFRHIEIRKGKR